MNDIEVSIVIPLYNEEEIFPKLINRLQLLAKSLPFKIEVLLIDDGSKDKTKYLIKETCERLPYIKGIILSRNFGHQLAVSAGLGQAKAEKAVFIIDGDLQDPPELLLDFYNKVKEGYDVVYGVRKKRKENFLKRVSYYTFYRVLNRISYFPIPEDSGDFCMISNRVVSILNSMEESSRFLRGMRSWVGFKQYGYQYERQERQAGSPKYDFKMLLGLATNGIFNFSTFPVKLITRMGMIGILFTLIYSIFILITYFSGDTVPSGFTTTIFAIMLFGSINILSLGVIGEYIQRIFFQTKNRPLYIIDEIINVK